MQSRVEKMGKIAIEAKKWPEELPFNVWTEEEAEKFLSFNNLTVPKKEVVDILTQRPSFLKRILMKLGGNINGEWIGLTIASYPGPNIIRNVGPYTYPYVLVNDFLNYTNAIYKKNDSICEWQLRLYIYPLYNSEVVDISHTMINHNDLDWNDKPIVVTAKKGFRIVRGYRESVEHWQDRVYKKLREERLKMQEAHEKRLKWDKKKKISIREWQQNIQNNLDSQAI